MKQSPRNVIKSWANSLQDPGFRLKGNLLRREVGILEHSIGLQRSQRVAPGKLKINLYIAVNDAFRETPESVVCLHGSVAPAKASFYDDESWWEERNLLRNGLDALMAHGLSWFDRFGKDARVLADWLENAVAENRTVEELVEPPDRAHPEIEALINSMIQGSAKDAPMNYHLFLSLLRLDQGNVSSACQHARVYLEKIKPLEGTLSEEPARTVRQLKKMGCVE